MIPNLSLGARARRCAPAPAAATLFAAFGLAAPATAQVIFSIDYKGARRGDAATGGGGLIRESDLLLPTLGAPAFHSLQPPQIFRNGASLGLPNFSVCTATIDGVPCQIELDAVSFGTDKYFRPTAGDQPRLFFSVDIHSVGRPLGIGPNVATEAIFGEVAADIFTPFNLPPGPLDITGAAPSNALVLDGNGEAGPSPFHYRGLGLVEPHLAPIPPAPPSPPYLIGGDDLDALVLPGPQPPQFIFYSVDGHLIEPSTGIPGSGTASTITPVGSITGSTVLAVPFSGGTPIVYATPADLGLDLFAPSLDDLDVLIVYENGIPGYQASVTPYDWLPGTPGQKDMLIFSVRRGSHLVQAQVLDSRFGRPIEPGDLLTPPSGSGLTTSPPGIWIAAENLGLKTQRTDGGDKGDDLDAGGTGEICYDCNGNGIEDSVDIATGSSVDMNGNGIPDECDSKAFCFSDGSFGDHTTPCPCANTGGPGNGCAHSFSAAGANLVAAGNLSPDTMILTTTNTPATALGLYMQHDTQGDQTFHDGVLCATGTLVRLRSRAAVGGTSMFPDSNFPNDATLTLSQRGGVTPGSGVRRFYATWYRNASTTFCPPATANVTNGWIIDW